VVESDAETMILGDLIILLRNKYVKSKLEFFMKDDQLYIYMDIDISKPGILVLINDTDWELEGKEEAELNNNDKICMISTLHGG